MNLLSSIFLGLLILFQTALSLEDQLGQMVWKKRVVVLYCPKASDTEFKLQKKWLSEVENQSAERDLQFIDCIEANLSKEDALYLKNHFDYKSHRFCFWLIGKDGGIKLVSHTPVKPAQLFGVIDAMPMRKNEMKGN